MKFCLGDLILESHTRIDKWQQNVSEYTGWASLSLPSDENPLLVWKAKNVITERERGRKTMSGNKQHVQSAVPTGRSLKDQIFLAFMWVFSENIQFMITPHSRGPAPPTGKSWIHPRGVFTKVCIAYLFPINMLADRVFIGNMVETKVVSSKSRIRDFSDVWNSTSSTVIISRSLICSLFTNSLIVQIIRKGC